MVASAADNGFPALENKLDFIEMRITLNLTAEDEHESHIKRLNSTIKERCRMGIAGLTFTTLPKIIVVELMYIIICWYNFTVPEDYVSNTLGPGSIVLGRTYNYNKLCGPGSKFGEYMQTHEKTTNTMRVSTVSAICLRPTGNTHGSFYYYSLWTGRRITRKCRAPLPMSQEVIDRVHSQRDRILYRA